MESYLEPTNLMIEKSCIAEEDLEESSDPDSQERIDGTSFYEATLAVEVFGAIGSLAQFRLTGAQKDFIVVGSDSSRIIILDYNKEKNVFDKIHQETFGKSGCRKIVPSQYISVDPKGRAVMIGACEKQKLVYVLNRDIATRLTISLSLEAHKLHTLVFSICGVDCGFESPIFAAIELDYSKADQDSTLNVKTGEMFRVEMVDWTRGAIQDDNSALNIKHVDLSNVHYLSGPIRVVDNEGLPALPGDLLAVEICNLGALPGDEWGFTATFDRENGGGFLTDHFPHATKAIWYFEGIYAYLPRTLRVRFPGITHPGIIGTAPSMELLNMWNEREIDVEGNGLKSLKLCEVLQSRPLANLPTPRNSHLGKIEKSFVEWEKIAREAARTVPGRENGGNYDIKNLSRGSKVYLPVFIEGENLNTGDMHFSQADGEVSLCGVIEMSGFLELKCDIIRGGMKEYLTPMGPTSLHVNPIIEIGPVEPSFSEWLVFEGISVDEHEKKHYLDATVAYKRVVLNAIDYMHKFSYTKNMHFHFLC
ncbi:uncharacterized protein LOC131604321 [Vicia villosa]|uniref:uncharacterized protein LOC131604321 n=1 Tax=Vicia villosa TaxID=3911 RepID=UPI00273BF287|nr:uncharacterized protein LOC131604321 [Vicia villosa]